MQNCYEYFIEAISTQEVALSYVCRHVFSHFLDTYTTPIFLHLMDGLIFFILTQFDLAFQPSFWDLILQTLLICGSRKGCLLRNTLYVFHISVLKGISLYLTDA